MFGVSGNQNFKYSSFIKFSVSSVIHSHEFNKYLYVFINHLIDFVEILIANFSEHFQPELVINTDLNISA
jgi:hypothetical protein